MSQTLPTIQEMITELKEKAIQNRYDFVVYFDVTNGNPNGDPDMNNLPRMDYETNLGYTTDGSFKRKLRDYIECAYPDQEGVVNHNSIYVKTGVPLETQHNKAYDYYDLTANGTKKAKGTDAESTQLALKKFMMDHFYDVRTFGAVMTTSSPCGKVTGPVQFGFGRSEDMISPQNITISRVTVTSIKEADKEQMLGKKTFIPYGLYRIEGQVSGCLAQQTGFSEADLQLLWQAIRNCWDVNVSAARGRVATRKLVVFKHDSLLGNAPSWQLFDRVKAAKNEGVSIPTGYQDYTIHIDDTNLPEGVSILFKE